MRCFYVGQMSRRISATLEEQHEIRIEKLVNGFPRQTKNQQQYKRNPL